MTMKTNRESQERQDWTPQNAPNKINVSTGVQK
jgi:hypothetical protein